MAAGVLTSRLSKFGKSRELPLHVSTLDALRAYIRQRDQLHPKTTAPSLFISTAGTRLLYCDVNWTFLRLVHQAGLKPRSKACRPRLHDLRHSFAVRTIIDAYRASTNVAVRLPLLSRYLGHVHPGNTYWYLSAAPELLGLGGQRLERSLEEPSCAPSLPRCKPSSPSASHGSAMRVPRRWPSCHGKGRKDRITPLTTGTVAELRTWLKERAGGSAEPLFPTRRGGALSRDALEHRLAQYGELAGRTCPSLRTKRISAQVLRHTAAMQLLQAAIDTSVIALWLGHEQVDTTHLHADLTMKERALARTKPPFTKPGRYRPADSLLLFLESL